MALIDRIREKLRFPDTRNRPLEIPGGPETVATIMVLVAKSDGGLSPDEHLRTKQLLQSRLGLNSVEALALIAEISETDLDASTVRRLLGNLRRELSPADKEELMLMVLDLIATDNEKHVGEMSLLNSLIDGLAIPETTMDRVYKRYFEARRGADSV